MPQVVVTLPVGSVENKKSFFKLLKCIESFQQAMQQLGNQLNIEDDTVSKCEKAICSLYGYDCSDVNLVRYEMLTKGAESHNIPPTKDALISKRTNYQTFV